MMDNHKLGPLLDEVLMGNPQALDQLLAKLRPYLHFLLRRTAGPEPCFKIDESDIVQEVMMKVTDKLIPDSSDTEGRFRGHDIPELLKWISKVLRNFISDANRKALAEKRDYRREARGSSVFATLTKGSSPEQSVLRAERAVKLAAALERLPLRDKKLLELRFVEQLSYAEIEECTGRTKGALRTAVTRALRTLSEDDDLLDLMGENS